MRHYEIVFLIHPDQSNQTDSLLKKFSTIVSDSGGVVHRSENIYVIVFVNRSVTHLYIYIYIYTDL